MRHRSTRVKINAHEYNNCLSRVLGPKEKRRGWKWSEPSER